MPLDFQDVDFDLAVADVVEVNAANLSEWVPKWAIFLILSLGCAVVRTAVSRVGDQECAAIFDVNDFFIFNND